VISHDAIEPQRVEQFLVSMTADSEVLPRFRAATSERRAYDFRTSTTKRRWCFLGKQGGRPGTQYQHNKTTALWERGSGVARGSIGGGALSDVEVPSGPPDVPL